ncbi:unannotated protein [freshwater metagenome]|uniref:Unannotated protein n=1 Tax=freshwater metagenome TaxID=449393 RepID=A0A6J6U4D8_9ZZZZ|nr:hypothetical protein [Actinomycetota bacterium]MSY72252.1 hypothetical protein [Actinomycetota bacterium]
MTDAPEPTADMPIDPEQMLAADASLAEFAAALRAPATPRELGGESAVLDLMVAAIAPPIPSKDRHMMKHRFARTAAIATVAVLSIGGVAAAATGTNPLRPIVNGSDNSSERPVNGLVVTNPTDESSDPPVPRLNSTTTSPTTTTAPPPTSTTIATNATTTECTEENHGAQVSEVAKDKSEDGERNHGAVVSAAAHDKNDCDEIDDASDDDDDDDGSATPGSGNSGHDSRSDKSGEGKKGR